MQSKRQRLGLLKQRMWRNERQAQPQRADPAIFFRGDCGWLRNVQRNDELNGRREN